MTMTLQIDTSSASQVIHVPPDRRHERLSDLLRQAGLSLNTRCGQRSLCEGCMVELLAGSLVHISSGQPLTAADEPMLLRGCEYRLDGTDEVRVRIPARSMLTYQPQIVTEYRINVPRAHSPMHQTIAIERQFGALEAAVGRLLGPSRSVRMSDLATAQVKELDGTADLCATVALREDHWLVTEVIEAGGPMARHLGAAIDIGTTTVALLLVDLADGRVLSQSAMFNQQMHLGDDVLTRITLCTNDPSMTRQFQAAIAIRTIAPLLEEALRKAGASPDELACLSIAGNSTMQHLMAGVNPAPMGVVPFTPVFTHHRIIPASDIFGDRSRTICREDAAVHLLPGPAAFVGADLCAGIVASGLLYDDGPSLLVDVGTNGEIILKHEGKLYGCATAAGPAFEGSGLSSGMRAGDGAISEVEFAADRHTFSVRWIGGDRGVHPAGICGSAYIDFLADARRAGLLTMTGRFDPDARPHFADRIIPWNDTDLALRLASSQSGQAIVISQLDVSRLLQAKAAIAAGLLTLLERVGLRPDEIKTLYLAGGFGTHMSRANAIACGLLPGFTQEQIQTVGNTSLAGAYIAMLDSGIVDEMARIRHMMDVVELNLDPNFEMRFIDQLTLPEPEGV